ncbi:hypothetical protein C5167_023507 [Papaver somniferum]|uniref:Uncharacterized protein n=1 Tax=Papaver somniferum TaxID=3469 RepID=A0A4Y7JP64_PAPSO|nr:hypothetical protein C5167_023507 [Papaver somniferum]
MILATDLCLLWFLYPVYPLGLLYVLLLQLPLRAFLIFFELSIILTIDLCLLLFGSSISEFFFF